MIVKIGMSSAPGLYFSKRSFPLFLPWCYHSTQLLAAGWGSSESVVVCAEFEDPSHEPPTLGISLGLSSMAVDFRLESLLMTFETRFEDESALLYALWYGHQGLSKVNHTMLSSMPDDAV